jgi:hypothetical protein
MAGASRRSLPGLHPAAGAAIALLTACGDAGGEGAGVEWRAQVDTIGPFSPSALWGFHPEGYLLSAVSDRDAIDLLRGESGVLRIEKEVEPVPVGSGERVAEEARVTRAMRNLDPGWRWEGPAIPQTKPLLRAVHAAEDGRIWVQLHQPGEPVPEEQLEAVPDGGPPIIRFREPTVFDVFEADGRYLGRVEAPDELPTYPRPIFRGDHVWSVVRDELGVQSVVRYCIEAGEAV